VQIGVEQALRGLSAIPELLVCHASPVASRMTDEDGDGTKCQTVYSVFI